MNKIIILRCFIFLLTLPLLIISMTGKTMATSAGIKLPQTRVIFDNNNKSALATIQNQGDNVYLVKVSILTDVITNSTPAPFVVMPPLFRLEPDNQQTVRITRQGTGALPADRESVFYLSFLAIPSIPEANQTDNRVAIGLQTVIKLFYRPERLAMTQEVAATKLLFHQNGKQLIVENPTPYYLTLGSLILTSKPLPFGETGQMIAPFSRQSYVYTGHATEVTWTVINDYGGLSKPYEAKISQQKVML